MKTVDHMMTGYFEFDAKDPIYRDHFPGNPVVPGSLIIHAFIEAAGRSAEGAVPWAVSRFRFKYFISPGRYAFRIEPKPDGLACYLFDDDKTVVTGTL